MKQKEWLRTYIKHAKFDLRTKANINKDEIYAGMTEQELLKLGISKIEIRHAMRKNWLMVKHFRKPGSQVVYKAYLYVCEASHQRGYKKLIEKLPLKSLKNLIKWMLVKLKISQT